MQRSRVSLGKTGLQVSPLGFGASPLGGVFRPIDEEDGVRAVVEAFKSGINYFDVSPYYGNTRAETVLGRGLRQLPRDEIVVGTKVGRYGNEFDFSAERVTRSIDESCARLGVDTLDIVLCHDIEFAQNIEQIVSETIPALHKFKESGKIRAIGVSGYPLSVYKYVMSSTSIPTDLILSYCHYNLHDDSLIDMASRMKAQSGIGVVNASVLSMGLLTQSGCPDWHPAPAELKAAASKAAQICAEAGEDLASVALRFAFSGAKDVIDATLLGIDSTATLEKNLTTLNEQGDIDPALLEKVLAVFKPVHNMTWKSGQR
ncbi:L-galactose dehydrogenase [Porphyridium purpureum]|uniref:L-galactose dehydrogenase n=1 Tax=Porphyridium purpureum TaxID=35688 RepID=A0A5J4YYN7_PORPP|nr:L-galactose dehydrogenase [Porphyridium purpureum]|eukprot:POR7625..scf208_2